MMTSLKKSRDLGYHFDLFWKYLWWVRYLPSLNSIGQVLLEKTRGVLPAIVIQRTQIAKWKQS